MSEADCKNTPLPSAKQNRAEAAAWLERRHREDWTVEDQEKFDVWLAASPAHMVAYVRVETAWKRADRLSVLRSPDSIASHVSPMGNAFSVMSIVAGILILAVLAGFAVAPDLFHSGQRVYATGTGGHRVITIADGTQIELNTETVLRTKAGSTTREVWLDKGEAFFRIAHDTKHPFVVFVGDRRVTDLGTKFVVRREPQRLEVALLEGRALFDAPNGTAGAPVILTPGDVITEKNNTAILTKKSSQDLSAELGWRRGMLIFKHTTLADAADEFNRYNSAKIIVADHATGALTIGGTFQADNIEVFARAMRDLLGVQVENRGNQTVISR